MTQCAPQQLSSGKKPLGCHQGPGSLKRALVFGGEYTPGNRSIELLFFSHFAQVTGPPLPPRALQTGIDHCTVHHALFRSSAGDLA
jgi:hypothetical protein